MKNISELAYELYKIDWKKSHMVTPEVEKDSLKDYYEGLVDFDDSYSYEEYIEEFGYRGGQLYSCYDEFIDSEYLDKEYIKELLNNDSLFEEYERDLHKYLGIEDQLPWLYSQLDEIDIQLEEEYLDGEIDWAAQLEASRERIEEEIFYLEGKQQKESESSMDIKNILNDDPKFRYQLLSRMKMDCDYYLGNEGKSRHPKHLWAGDEKEQIEVMKALWNSFPEGEKPEWLRYDEILDYEKKMLNLSPEEKFIVYKKSPGGIKETINEFETEQEAVEFAEMLGWKFKDENDFVWDLEIAEVQTKSHSENEKIHDDKNEIMKYFEIILVNYDENNIPYCVDTVCCTAANQISREDAKEFCREDLDIDFESVFSIDEVTAEVALEYYNNLEDIPICQTSTKTSLKDKIKNAEARSSSSSNGKENKGVDIEL